MLKKCRLALCNPVFHFFHSSNHQRINVQVSGSHEIDSAGMARFFSAIRPFTCLSVELLRQLTLHIGQAMRRQRHSTLVALPSHHALSCRQQQLRCRSLGAASDGGYRRLLLVSRQDAGRAAASADLQASLRELPPRADTDRGSAAGAGALVVTTLTGGGAPETHPRW